MFRTGMGRQVPMSQTSIDKAKAVLEEQTIAEQGHFDKSMINVLNSSVQRKSMPLPVYLLSN
jgi:hypothetical protein